MKLLLTKYAVTAFVVVLVSEVARRSDRAGALISALPLVTIMVMIWLYIEGQGAGKIANHAFFTFWYVLPTLPMFLLIPFLLTRGWGFWISLFFGIVLTFISFLITGVFGRLIGIKLLP